MNENLINRANSRASNQDDLIIHVGDFYCYGSDRGSDNIKENPRIYINRLTAQFVNIRGNHDKSNKMISVGDRLLTNIGPFKMVYVSHHPSDDHNSRVKSMKNIIHICGHVHGRWKYFYDEERNIININVGIDAWKYNIVSEMELVVFIDNLARHHENIKKLVSRWDSRLIKSST
jgi:calcineurin-like phosphoesterase family protein